MSDRDAGQVPVVEAVDLVAGYRHGRRSSPMLDVASLRAPAGQLTAVIGPNGSGKSTLLRTLVGSQPPLAGDVLPRRHRAAPTRPARASAQGRRRAHRSRRSGVVDGRRRRAPRPAPAHRLARRPRPPTTKRIAHAAARRLGVDALWLQPFAELSDGQRQRVLVARALAQQPTVLVLDEPTAFLDIAGRIELTLMVADSPATDWR